METKKNTPIRAAGAFDPTVTPASHYSCEDIARCVRQGEVERAVYISAMGTRLWQSLSALWRRPGSMIPPTYRMTY